MLSAKRESEMSKAKVLKYDVFVAPELPFNGPPARVANSIRLPGIPNLRP